MADASFITKFGLNLIIRRLDSQPFMKISIHDYLWNMTDPLLAAVESIAPFLIPTKQIGILTNVSIKLFDQPDRMTLVKTHPILFPFSPWTFIFQVGLGSGVFTLSGMV